MAFNRDNYSRIREEYENKYQLARDAANAKKAELHEKYPELAKIDAALSSTGPAVFAAAMKGRDRLDERIAEIKSENVKLRKARTDFLIAHGYPADYTDVKYECEKCCDSGFVDGKMCSCMREKLVMAGYESAGVANLIKEQSFDTFSLDYYKKNRETYERMSHVFRVVKDYAEEFSQNRCDNLLMMGGTGLGKTHLSSALAKRIVERGFDVQYVSALKMISDFEGERFKGEGSSNTSRYYDCDLLIIDDLGCEVSNQFTVSCVYDVVNMRINLKKSTVISTNLSQSELRAKYWDRITSRLFGEYRPLLFVGTDVRAQKLSE